MLAGQAGVAGAVEVEVEVEVEVAASLVGGALFEHARRHNDVARTNRVGEATGFTRRVSPPRVRGRVTSRRSSP
jgi:hypothetical protein